MPFVASRPLETMLDPDAADRCAKKIAHNGTDRLVFNTQRNTPVDTSPFGGDDRPPGTLRRSVHAGPVIRISTPLGPAYRGTARTFDPVAPHVEWTTKPHVIRPRRPAGTLHWRDAEGHHFAKVVHHPGTRGQHMFAIGAAITEMEVGEIAAVPLREFEHDLVTNRSGRVTGLDRFNR